MASLRRTPDVLRFVLAPLVLAILCFAASQTDTFAAGGGTLSNGGNYSGSILRGQIDQWTFSANEGDAIDISVSEVGKNSFFTPQIQVFAPNKKSMGVS